MSDKTFETVMNVAEWVTVGTIAVSVVCFLVTLTASAFDWL
jgi:hypothetical protein